MDNKQFWKDSNNCWWFIAWNSFIRWTNRFFYLQVVIEIFGVLRFLYFQLRGIVLGRLVIPKRMVKKNVAERDFVISWRIRRNWTRNVLKREKQVSKLGHPHKITNAFYFHYMDPSYPILFLHLNYHISRTWSKIHDYIPKLIVSYLINSNILHLKFQFLSRYNHFEQHFSILNEIQKFYLIK